MSQFSTSTENQVQDKAACRLGVCPSDRLCATCEFPPKPPSADGFPHHLVDFELWLRNSHESLSAFGGQFADFQNKMITALALIDQFRVESAINFGDDVNTAPTSPAVPVGNTGTTSTGRVL